MSEQGETDQEKDLKMRGFDFIRGGNSAAYILKHFNDFEKESGKKILKIKDLESKLAEANAHIVEKTLDAQSEEKWANSYKKQRDELEKKLAVAVEAINKYGLRHTPSCVGENSIADCDCGSEDIEKQLSEQ